MNAKRVMFSDKDEYEPRFDDEDADDYPSPNLLDDEHVNEDPDSPQIPLTEMDSLDGISPGTTSNSEQEPSALSSLLTWGLDLIKPSSPSNGPDEDDEQNGSTKEKEESSTQEEEEKESESEKADNSIPEEGEDRKTKKKKKRKSEKGGSPSSEEGEDKKSKKKKKGKSEKEGSPSAEEGEDKKSKKKKKGKSEKGVSPSPGEKEDKKSKKKKKGGKLSGEEGENKKAKKKSKRDKSGNWNKSHELDGIHSKSSPSGDRHESTVGRVDAALNRTEVAAAKQPSEDSSQSKVCSKVIPDYPKSMWSVFRNVTVLKAAMKFKSKLRNKNRGKESKTEYDKLSANAVAFSEEGDHRNTLTGLKTKAVARKPPVDVISLWESNVPQTQEIVLLGGSILQPVKRQKIVLTKLGDKTSQQSITARTLHQDEPSQADRDEHSSLSAMETSAKSFEGSSPKPDICLSRVPYSDSSSDIYPSSHTTSSSQCQLFSFLDCDLTSEASSLTLKDYESLESQSQVIKTGRGSRQCLDLKAGVPRPDHLESRTSDTFEMTSSSTQYPQTSEQSFHQRPRRSQEYSLKSKLSDETPDQRLCGSQEYSLTSQLSGQIPYHERRRHRHRRGDNSSTPTADSYPH